MFNLNPPFSCPQRKLNPHPHTASSLLGKLLCLVGYEKTRGWNQSVHRLPGPGIHPHLKHRLCHMLLGGTPSFVKGVPLSLQRLTGFLLLLRHKSVVDYEIPLHTHSPQRHLFTQFSPHRNWVPCRMEPLNLTCGGLHFRPGQRHVVTGWAVSRICTFAEAGPSHHTSHRWELFDAKCHGILWGFVSASRGYLPFK